VSGSNGGVGNPACEPAFWPAGPAGKRVRSLKGCPTKSARVLYYSLPMLFCLAVHWMALRIWFFQDDFVWLGLHLEVHSWRDLAVALFNPKAQGTVRALSERLFFLVFTWTFGLHALPFRVWVFLTQFANVWLLMRVVERLTASRIAAFLAPILWCANAGLALAIGWTSAYNEVACAFFLLLAFFMFLRYLDANRRGYWVATWIVFILGFGALELMVVFPVLAAGYAFLFAGSHVRRALLLFIPSVLFGAAHYLFIPKIAAGPYAMHFGASMIAMLAKYWMYAVAACRDKPFGLVPWQVVVALGVAITALLGTFIIRRALKRDWLPLFCLGWFLVVLLPVLPLRDHFMDYYVTVPAIGLSMLGAYALAFTRIRIVAGLLACAYLAFSIRDVWAQDQFRLGRSEKIHSVLLQLQAGTARAPGKTILLKGIPPEVFVSGFNTGVNDDPFRLVGLPPVFLAPDSENTFKLTPGAMTSSRYYTSHSVAITALKHGAVVYEYTPAGLQDITRPYFAELAAKHPESFPDNIDVGNTIFADLLEGDWYAIEFGHRWMGKSALLHIAGPSEVNRKLYIMGYCDAVLLVPGPVTATFRADDVTIGSATLSDANKVFHLVYPLPESSVGKPKVAISIEVNHTVRPAGATRDLGLVFGTFTIR